MAQTSRERRFKCSICLEDDVPWSHSTSVTMLPCRGHTRLCKPCAALHIATRVEQRRLPLCPIPRCNKAFDPIGCGDIVTGKVLAQWLDLLCRSAISGSISCVCPNIECRELILNECGRLATGSSGNVDCPSCQKSFCFTCGSAWKRGTAHRCVDPTLNVIRNSNWVRCPGCKFYVERSQGCDLILCRCRVHFCYKCGRKVSPLYHHCASGVRRLHWLVVVVGIISLALLILLILFFLF